MEAKFVTNGAGSECRLYVDGTQECVVNGFSASYNTAGIRFGLVDYSYTVTVNVDAVVIDSSYIGPG